MKYTRYEYKKYEKLKFVFSIVLIATITIAGGLYASKFLFKGNLRNLSEVTEGEKTEDKEKNSSYEGIIALQCGYYSNAENAEKALDEISNNNNSCFIYEDEGKFRVMAGIYLENEVPEKVKEFTDEGIETSKKRIEMKNESEDERELYEIISGYLTVSQKLHEEGVKSIKTAEFKKWANNIAEGNENNKVLLINDIINNMPEELDTEKMKNINSAVYKVISEK